MKEVFEKIKERLKKEVIALEDNYGDLVECIPSKVVFEIVNQVAEEYGKDTNAHSNEFDTIYNKVLKLEKQYAKVEGNMEAVNDCIRLENLLQYFKEELQSEVEE